MPEEDDTPQTEFFRRYAQKLIQDARADSEMTYESLAKALHSYGVDIEPQVLNNRIVRGRFSFVFALQLLAALGIESIHIPDPPRGLKKPSRLF